MKSVVVLSRWFLPVLMGLGANICLGETFLVPSEVSNIQSAIIAAADGDTIVIAPGIYTGLANRDISFLGKAITVRSEDPNDPNVVMATIIDADGSEGDEHRGFVFELGEDANSLLEGVTIINGYANTGGGILCRNSSPTIRHCSVSNCSSTGNGGGGIYLEISEAEIFNCMINSNVALDGDGGGVGCFDSNDLRLENCRIYDNFASGGLSQGGGIYCNNSTLVVSGSRIYANRSVFGGGLYCFDNSLLTLDHCRILGNSANNGGGVYNQDSTVIIEHCVLSANRAFSSFGGGVRCFSEGSLTLRNSILWANIAADGTGHEIILTPTGNEAIALTVAYCNLQGGQEKMVIQTDSGEVSLDWQAGNIDIDPLFVMQGFIDDSNTPGDLDDDLWHDGDYRLQVASLSIDRGDPNSDFDNEPLPNGDRVNMGAFGNTPEATLSIRNAITLTRGSVKGDSRRLVYPVYDAIKLKGLLYADVEDAQIEDFLGADSITIRIDVVDGNDLPLSNILLDTFAIEYDPNKVTKRMKFNYRRPKLNTGAIRQFKVDYKRNTFQLNANKIDLTGLRFPFKLEIAYGDYLGDIVIHNTEELASRKGPPRRLLMGVSDELEVTKAKVRTTSKGDTLTAKGYITMAQANLTPPIGELEAIAQYLDLTDPNTTGGDITILWNLEDIEVLPAELFEEISVGRFRYPTRRTAPIGVIRKLDLDFNRCRFYLSVKESPPLVSTGTVPLEIFTTSGNFDVVELIEFE